MPNVDLSPETLARLEAQLQADLDAVRRVRALLAAPKNPAHPSPAPLPAAPVASAVPSAVEEKVAPTLASAVLPQPAPGPAAAPFVPPPSAAVAVSKALPFMDGTFGPRELKEIFAREHLGGHADPDIRRVLKGMVKTGELRIVSSSVGRGGSTYERVVKG